MRAENHPNGFLKIVIWELPDGRQHRLHVYETPLADSDIHQHRADFTSQVIEGVLKEEFFAVADLHREPEPGDLERLDAVCTSGRLEVHSFGPCKVKLLETLWHKAGETYQVAATDFHRVTAVEVPAVTLVTTGDTYNEVHTLVRGYREAGP